jgi:hypothetical protein
MNESGDADAQTARQPKTPSVDHAIGGRNEGGLHIAKSKGTMSHGWRRLLDDLVGTAQQ